MAIRTRAGPRCSAWTRAAKNAVGYNFEGFGDEHFDASRYTTDGPYVRFGFKADQDTFRDLDLSRLRPGSR